MTKLLKVLASVLQDLILGALLKTASNRTFVSCNSLFRETICPSWKRDYLYSFWSRTFPQIYIYGRKFTIINDHQPLKSNFRKSIVTCPPGIQIFFPGLQKCESNLEYAHGKTMLVLDISLVLD